MCSDWSFLSLPSIFNFYYLTFSGIRIFYSLSILVLSTETLWLSLRGFEPLKSISLTSISQVCLLKTIHAVWQGFQSFFFSPSGLHGSQKVGSFPKASWQLSLFFSISNMEIEKKKKLPFTVGLNIFSFSPVLSDQPISKEIIAYRQADLCP